MENKLFRRPRFCRLSAFLSPPPRAPWYPAEPQQRQQKESLNFDWGCGWGNSACAGPLRESFAVNVSTTNFPM